MGGLEGANRSVLPPPGLSIVLLCLPFVNGLNPDELKFLCGGRGVGVGVAVDLEAAVDDETALVCDDIRGPSTAVA